MYVYVYVYILFCGNDSLCVFQLIVLATFIFIYFISNQKRNVCVCSTFKRDIEKCASFYMYMDVS